MPKLNKFLLGIKVLEEIDSPINGRLTVVRDLAWGTHIKAKNLTQTGGVAETVWKAAIKKVYRVGFAPSSCLILGLGGGSGAKLVRQAWPNCKITGVDIDKIVVDLGKKYLDLDKYDVKTIIKDAEDFVNHSKHRFDLILIDMYTGDEIPKKFTTKTFFQKVKTLTTSKGLVLVNRLYYGQKINEAKKTQKTLEQIFTKVTPVFPEANVIFVCAP